MRKPLIVVGARKVGKTYTITKFCEENFANFLYFNLKTDAQIKNIFEKKLDDKMIFERLELCLGRRIDVENTIIFFDEIQESKNFISSLQYFTKSKLPYKIICTGDLLNAKIEKVKLEYMYPMNFEEFLLAANKKVLLKKIKDCYDQMCEMPELEHEEAFSLYRKYLCVGGLPEAVINFVENDLNILDYDKSVISSIVELYKKDMECCAKNKAETKKLKKIYENIPVQLLQDLRNFRYNLIDKDGRKRKYQAPLNWLFNANLILPSYNTNNAESFKLYFNDVGILSYVSGANYIDIMLNKEFDYKDAIVRNYIAEQLTANEVPLSHWIYSKSAKIDFLIKNEDGLIPIAVRSGKVIKSAGLNAYMKKISPKYAIRLASTNFYFLQGVKSVPLYAAFCIRGE